MAVTRFTSIYHRGRRWLPWFLVESGTAAAAGYPACVVLTRTLQQEGACWILGIADVRVPVTNAPTTDTDVLDAVVIPSSDGRIPLSLGDEMTQ